MLKSLKTIAANLALRRSGGRREFLKSEIVCRRPANLIVRRSRKPEVLERLAAVGIGVGVEKCMPELWISAGRPVVVRFGANASRIFVIGAASTRVG